MKNTNPSKKPVAVKPAVTKIIPARIVSTRAPEKIGERIPEMGTEKVLHWLSKTSRTIVNHYDITLKKRRCTEAYWNGLISRYTALSKKAQDEKVWDSYCKSIGKPVDHVPTDFLV